MSAKDLRINLLLDYYGEMLTPKQREAMDLYYNEDMSLFEISEHINVTRQGVHDLIKRSETALLETDGKLGFVKRFEQMRDASKILSEAIDGAKRLNSKKIYTKELNEIIKKLEFVKETLQADE